MTDTMKALVAAAYEAAANLIADYPRSSPDYDEWTRYDEQIEHSQNIIRALTPADAKAAYDAAIAAAVQAERERCASVVKLLEGRDMTGTGCMDAGEGYDLALVEAADAILKGPTP